MSTSIRKVAVAGATGSLGAPVTEALAKAGFEVTALTRDASKAKLPAGVKAVTIDYDSKSSIQAALKGQDALVSTLSQHFPGQFDLLFDTAIEEGVKRVIPSEFGSDTISEASRKLPVYAPKVALQDRIKEKTAGTSTTYTFILNNAFLDWGLTHDFILNRKTKTATLFDGGDKPFTLTPLDRVGDGVVGVLKRPEETANRVVKLHGIKLTQKQLLERYQKHTSADGWSTPVADTEKDLEQSYVTLKNEPQNVMAWLMPQLAFVAFGKHADNDWENSNDNVLLGVKPVTEAELDAYVKAAVL